MTETWSKIKVKTENIKIKLIKNINKYGKTKNNETKIEIRSNINNIDNRQKI